ncbi:MAG TPA: GAF domain-containing protein [Vicinamibacterales bacterium]|nr:GAF domain-containing protein [Vicinamibacterales bacterium]
MPPNAPITPGSTSLVSAVSALADALATATCPQQIFDAALQGIRDAVGVERASVLLFDDDGVMRFKAWLGLSDAYRAAVEGHSPWPPGAPAPAPIVVSDVQKDATLADYQPVFARENIRALAFVPLVSRGKTIGKFMLYWAHPRLVGPEVLDAALTIGALAGLAVDRARQNAELLEHQQRMEVALQQEAQTRERLTRLAEGAQRLQISLDGGAMVGEVLALAQQTIAADGYAVWRRDGQVWRVVSSVALDARFTAVELPANDSFTFSSPLIVPDVQAHALLEIRRPAYAAAGIQSLFSIPLQIRGRPGGSIAFYYRTPHEPSELELRVAQALGHLSAAAISSAELYAEQQHQRTLALRTADRSSFLAETSGRLNSLEYEHNLELIANMAVPRFADCCVVDLLEAGELRRLAVAHVDPARVELAHELHRRYPPRRDLPAGPWRVVTTGEPELYERIDETTIEGASRDDEHLEMLRGAGLRSAMLVPLRRVDDVFGVLTFALAGSDRTYDASDLEFALELGRRASFAIENARLYRQAQDANRAKDEFLAALSHELRTPLNAILGWASILRARPDSAMERGLDVIYRNAQVQTQLVEDLLDASRIVSGRMSIDLRDAPLRPIVEAAIEILVPEAAEKDIELTASLPAPDLLIRGDAARLQQVFWNVLSNAVKFTPRYGRISLTTETTPSEVSIHMTDTGAGIRPEALPFIFDRFRQADASTTRRYRGLGLGLTLSRQLTEMHGGRIAAISPGPGLGATFTVALPLVDRTASTPAPRPRPTAHNALAGLRILAVDDDPDSLDVLTSILRLQQAIVFGATSAVEALELLRKERPDVVISDIAMPEHDGYWLMQQIQRMLAEGAPAVRCIALTAFANAAARERALAAGFAAHLSKPFDPDELVAGVRPLTT